MDVQPHVRGYILQLGPVLRTALKLSIRLPCQRDVKCVDAKDGPPANSFAVAPFQPLNL